MPNDPDASDHPRNCGRNYRIPADFLDRPPDPDEPPFGPFPADFQKSFEIAIQLGAIVSVIVLYWRRFLELAVVSRVLVAFLPTGLIGLSAVVWWGTLKPGCWWRGYCRRQFTSES